MSTPNVKVSHSSCDTCDNINQVNNTASDPTLQKYWWLTFRLFAIISAIIILGIAIFTDLTPTLQFGLYLISYLLVGGEILYKAGRNLVSGKIFDENFLMSIATLGAFIIGEYLEGVAVMLFYQIGEYLQSIAVSRSRHSISALLNIRPDTAHLQIDGDIKTVSPEEVKVGDTLIIKPGERVPLDGIIKSGQSTLDTSALTGEAMPRLVESDDEIFSGSINNSGLLTITVTKTYDESTATKIIKLVEEAAENKAPTENFITKFARYYTPAVVFAALALAFLPPLLVADATISTWGYRALVFLIISCPCALVVSIPLSFFGGIGAASRNGILVKGSNYLEAFNAIETVAFDKTGTLTVGKFGIKTIVNVNYTEDEVLEYAAYAESFSNHPIAISIKNHYPKAIDQSLITDYKEEVGHGITATVKGRKVVVGNQKIMDKHQIPVPPVTVDGSIVHVAIDQKYAGYIIVADQIKPSSAQAITALRQLGVKNVVMLSGDNEANAKAVGDELGIDRVYAELLPQDKVKVLEDLLNEQNQKTVFVGDGINDAPVLARADIGIAMGGLGSDAAVEAADVVFMTDDISKLGTSIRIVKIRGRSSGKISF